ncbi:MAG: PilZ domain-containing protein [Magnetococcales bacterium]|nr:PilZ domain-containing protein [Magnetococcales bacterium]
MDFLDFLYESEPKASKNSFGENVDDAVVVSEKKTLMQLLSFMTMEGDFPINVRIGSQIFDYHSFLKLDMVPGQHMEANLYLIIDALDPAIGNLRIRKSSSVVIRMSTKRYNLEFVVNYIDLYRSNIFKLSFPETILIRTEKRSSVRVSIDKKWSLTANLTRDAGITFPVKLMNISSGGIYFKPPSKLPTLLDGGNVVCHFKWKSQNIVCNTSAAIIQNAIVDEVLYYRCRFQFEQYDISMRDLEALVATAQLRQIRRRKELYKDFKTPTEVGDSNNKAGKKKKK